jgi:hypothetical protein
MSIDTVNDLPPRVQYVASAAQTVFPYPFPIFDDADLVVDVDGTTASLGVDYTVAGEGDDTGGDVTWIGTAMAAGEIVTIYRDISIARDTDISQNGPWSSTAYNDEQDKVFLILQQLKAQLARSLRLPIIAEVDDADIELEPANFANMYLSFDADGKPTPAALSATTMTRAILGQFFYPQSAAEAGLTITDLAVPYGYITRYWSGSGTIATAWASADTQAAAGGAPIYVPKASGGYGTDAALTADYRSDIVFEPGAYISYTGSSNIAALTIGSTDNTLVAFSRRYERLNVQRTAQSDWTNNANIGIRFYNITGSHIDIAQVNGFTIGVQTLPSNGAGFQYNEVHLGQLYNNRYAIELSNATNGYTNENNWYGGRFTNFSGVNSSTTRYGVRITSSDAVYKQNNNNHFWKPSFEMGALDASVEAVPVLMVHGINNHFHGCRDEDNDTPFVRESNASSENSYDIGYSSYITPPTVESTSTAPVWVATNSGRGGVFSGEKRLVFSSGPMHKRACFYDGGTNIHVPGVSIADAGSATVFTALDSITLNANYLDTTRAFSVFVNTTVAKQFIVATDCESGRGGRFIVNCYDAAGALITTALSVQGSLAAVMSSTANYGGAFMTGGDSNDDCFFTVSSAVKSIRVSVGQGTASLRIRSFAVYSVNTNTHCDTWTGYTEIAPGQNIGTAAPTAGTWTQGRIVHNATPAAGGTPGWVCTTGGTPGTWKAMANVAA